MKLFVAYAFLFCSTFFVINAISLQKRIYEGVQANEGEFPYQGRVFLNGTYRCGCGLVSKYHCVTAGHCVEEVVQYGWHMIIKVGSIHLNEGISHDVRRVSYHPGFTKASSVFVPNDIGMIHLVHPVEISANVQLIRLPPCYSEIRVSAELIVTGFGRTGKNQPMSPYLMKLETEDINIDDCQPFFLKQITRAHTCTQNRNGKGCYFGDGGNPLVDKTKSTIIGVLSGIKGTCNLGDPDVFTKISHYMVYIKAEINYDPNDEGLSATYPARNFPDINGNIYPIPHDLERCTIYVIN